MFDRGSNVTITRGGKYATEVYALPLYKQYVLQAPSYKAFGPENSAILLEDAVVSYIASVSKCGALSLDINSEDIVKEVMKYSAIYYRCGDENTQEGVLQLLRSRLADILRTFQEPEQTNSEVNKFVERIFEGCRNLIIAGK